MNTDKTSSEPDASGSSAPLKPLKAPTPLSVPATPPCPSAAPPPCPPAPPAADDAAPARPVSKTAPGWLSVLCFLAIVLMANQVRIKDPGLLGKLALSDIAFMVGFLAVVSRMFLYRTVRVRISLCALLPVIGLCVANGFAGSGIGGCVDAVQMAMLLVGGTVFFAYVIQYMTKTALIAVTCGLVLNLCVAALQDMQYGAFLTLAPKDVIELAFGFGNAVTGLFRSRIAFSLYLAATLSWLLPQWLSIPVWQAVFKPVRVIAVLLILAAGLLYIPNGMIALLACAVLIASGFAVSRKSGIFTVCAVALAIAASTVISNGTHLAAWKATLSPLKGYDYQEDASILFNQPAPRLAEEPSAQAHELKSAHYDFAAALRVCRENALYGVGSGNYQKCIGKAYTLNEDRRMGQLVNARINDIETDSQAGWGILAATIGLPASLLFALFFLAMLGRNVARIREDDEDGLMLHAGAAAAIAVFILSMFLTDPLTRGLGWTLALAIASAETGPANRSLAETARINEVGRCGLVLIAIVLILAIAFIPLWKKLTAKKISEPAMSPAVQCVTTAPAKAEPAKAEPVKAELAKAESAKSEPAKTEPAKAESASPAPVKENATEDTGHILTAGDDDEVYLVFNADKAIHVTMPMRMGKDETETFAKGVLVIPDKAGVPPTGKKPALEYGGAEYEFILTQAATVYLWCNVLWDGSCGNTLDIKMDDEAQSYTIGNDGTYHAWHWQQSPKSYKLAPGRHKITVLNREDGIMLSQVLVTNDKESIPEGVEGE